MGGSLNANVPAVVSAFHHALLGQSLVVLVLALVLAVVWNVCRSVLLARAATGSGSIVGSVQAGGPVSAEPAARRLLRIGFGLLWLFDGILQAQASMPLGMVSQVVKPAASTSPGWLQHLVTDVSNTWSYHPVVAASAAVWIQVGLGLWLLVAPRGKWSRLGGMATVGWGAVVWVFGEAFGGIFAPGLTWLFGAPGAVVFYCAAGALVALPERYWGSPRLGRGVLDVIGAFFVGMAVLQAWPGRGFWHGRAAGHATTGSLLDMVRQMAATPQPHPLSAIVSAFAGFDAAHGWVVNLFTVIALAVVGMGFFARHPRLLRAIVIAAVVLCMADWLLVQDLGFMGGVGTDPNSMIPMALILVAAWSAATRPAGLPDPTVVPITAASKAQPVGWRQRLGANPTYTFRVAAALSAAAVVTLGAAPMAIAATEPNADPILAEAVDGPAQTDTFTMPPFHLVNQNGRAVTSASLRGKVLALTFLDPVCSSDCPIIAQEFRAAAKLLGSNASRVDLVAIDANPRYSAPEYLEAFTQQEQLGKVRNWLFLTGSLPQLKRLWKVFGVDVEYEPGGSMIGHSDVGYVIDATGHGRYALDTDPGPATGATSSSFAVILAHALRSALIPKETASK